MMTWESEKARLCQRIGATPSDQLEALITSLPGRQITMLEEIHGEKFHYSLWKDEIPTSTWDEALETAAPGTCWKVVEADDKGQALPNGEIFSVHAFKHEAESKASAWNIGVWGEYCNGYQMSPYVDIVR